MVTNEKTLECVVIDPGDESNTILNYLEENHLHCKGILITHGHFDHVGAVEAVRLETGAPVYMNRLDDARVNQVGSGRFYLPDDGSSSQDGDTVDLAGLHFDVIGTPGHTPGGVTLRCENALFTGDELLSLKKLCELEGDYEVYPGHLDSSTLARERMFNFYCREACDL